MMNVEEKVSGVELGKDNGKAQERCVKAKSWLTGWLRGGWQDQLDEFEQNWVELRNDFLRPKRGGVELDNAAPDRDKNHSLKEKLKRALVWKRFQEECLMTIFNHNCKDAAFKSDHEERRVAQLLGWMLNNGADPLTQIAHTQKKRNSLLAVAAQRGWVEGVAVLLSCGANPKRMRDI